MGQGARVQAKRAPQQSELTFDLAHAQAAQQQEQTMSPSKKRPNEAAVEDCELIFTASEDPAYVNIYRQLAGLQAPLRPRSAVARRLALCSEKAKRGRAVQDQSSAGISFESIANVPQLQYDITVSTNPERRGCECKRTGRRLHAART